MVLPLFIVGVPAAAAVCYGTNYGGHIFACKSLLGRTPQGTFSGQAGGFFVGASAFSVVTRLVGASAANIDVKQAQGSFEDAFWRENRPKAFGYGCALLVGSAVMGKGRE
jgi:hypothetical protein